jgi:hypothetical protein
LLTNVDRQVDGAAIHLIPARLRSLPTIFCKSKAWYYFCEDGIFILHESKLDERKAWSVHGSEVHSRVVLFDSNSILRPPDFWVSSPVPIIEAACPQEGRIKWARKEVNSQPGLPAVGTVLLVSGTRWQRELVQLFTGYVSALNGNLQGRIVSETSR